MIILLETLCTVIPTVVFFFFIHVCFCGGNCASAFNDPGFCLVGNIISDIKKGARNSQINYMKLEALYQNTPKTKEIEETENAHEFLRVAIHETEGKYKWNVAKNLCILGFYSNYLHL